jgi:vacuolar iron transporter family protein
MALVLVVFGYVKTCVVRGRHGKDNVVARPRGALQMLAVGIFAAGAAVGSARLVNARSVWLVYSKEAREGVSHILPSPN